MRRVKRTRLALRLPRKSCLDEELKEGEKLGDGRGQPDIDQAYGPGHGEPPPDGAENKLPSSSTIVSTVEKKEKKPRMMDKVSSRLAPRAGPQSLNNRTNAPPVARDFSLVDTVSGMERRTSVESSLQTERITKHQGTIVTGESRRIVAQKITPITSPSLIAGGNIDRENKCPEAEKILPSSAASVPRERCPVCDMAVWGLGLR
ncbi:unnamed protein product, partial [Discosporangium mesarthrocarpum]